jgi:hypothetical protein
MSGRERRDTNRLPLTFRCACGWMKYARFGYTHHELFGLLREFAEYSFHGIEGTKWVPVDIRADTPFGDYVALPAEWRTPVDAR